MDASTKNPKATDSPRLPLAPLLNLRISSPLRPPDWRWRLAEHWLLQRKRRSRRSDDAVAVRTLQFQKVLVACQGEPDRLKLSTVDRSLHAAWELWLTGSAGLQAELQARILARQSDAEIAGKLRIDRRTISLYERVYFHVRDRLDCRSWVHHQVIGASPTTGDEASIQKLWRLYAYEGGPHVLEHLLGRPSPARPKSAAEVGAFLRDDMRQQLTIRAAMALRLLPLDDPKTALQLVKIWMRVRIAKERLKATCVPDHQIQEHLDAFSAGTGWMDGLAAQPSGSPAAGDEPTNRDILPFGNPAERFQNLRAAR